MKYILPFVLGVVLVMNSSFARAQGFESGESYLDSNNYVQYLPGNIPIVLSSPHGGYIEPDSIPDRDCDGCVYARDSYTQELTMALREEIYNITGCYPYAVINLLHRKKFDANRSIETAADGNTDVEESWYTYHAFIDTAKATIIENYGRGLFLDMHGHAHDIERIELGYLFTRSELQLSDEELNTADLIDETAIKQLVTDNSGELTCSEMIRSEHSLGEMLQVKGFPSVPSAAIPFPLDEEPYFNGGHNTVLHGSKNGGLVDAIQLEFNSDVRWDETLRNQLADSLALSLIQYIELHYFPGFATHYCLLPELGIESEAPKEIIVYPNPTISDLQLTAELGPCHITIHSLTGEIIFKQEWNGDPIDVSSIESGSYILHFQNKQGKSFYSRIIKK